jgi:hypothetical protein
MNSKSDFIKSFQNSLSSQFRGAQNWWTKYLFHFTDINNSLSILEHQSLLSRDEAMRLGLMKNDNANDQVIGITSAEYKRYARLYFAPATPTQHNNEGVKPKDFIVNNAHCPVPIMFVFHFARVFMLDDVKFTDGNLANNPNIYDEIDDLDKLDFNLIYHRTWFEAQHRDTIIHARHSEILVKDRLPLEGNLKMLIVRSQAEKEMLLYRMNEQLRSFYQDKIFIQPRTGIFTNNWLYINKISIIENVIVIDWHGCDHLQKCQDRYSLKISIKNLSTKITRNLEKQNWYPMQNIMKIALPDEFEDEGIELSVFVDGGLVYVGGF